MDEGGKTYAEMLFEAGAGWEKANEIYNRSSLTYDEYMLSHNYTAHLQVAEKAAQLFSSRDVRLLDVAAGTGLVGLELHKRGFGHVDAVDGSEGMLKEAAGKNVYTTLLCAFLSDQPLDLPPASYDGVVCAGSFGHNHLPVSVFSEMVRLVKPGGYVIMAWREMFQDSYKGDLDRKFQQLEDDGKWKMVSHETYSKHYDDTSGVLYVFRVL